MFMKGFTTHYKNKRFQDERVELDGSEFSLCDFNNCLIVLESGDTQIRDCRFYSCKLVLQGNAYTIAKIITAVTGKKPLKVIDMEEPLFTERPDEEGGG